MKNSILKRITAFGMVAALSCGMIAAPETFSGIKDTIAITASAAADIANGTLGNMTWRINSAGTLIIDVDGHVDSRVIPNFSQGGAPWYPYRNQIKKVALPPSLRGIGNYAFYNLKNLTLVYNASDVTNPTQNMYLPAYLSYIGEYAFANCQSLEGTTSNNTLVFGVSWGMFYDLTIKKYAFRNCYKIKKIDLESSYSVTLEQNAFGRMTSLTYADLNVANLTLNANAFYSCPALEKVRMDIDATVDSMAFNGTVFDAYAQAVSGVNTEAAMAAKVGALVNKERTIRNIAPVKFSSQVAQPSQTRANELTSYYSHTRPNGTSCFTALNEAGISYNRAGENIAAGYTSPSDVMNGWMNSEGHRNNILNAEYNYMGVGEKYKAGTTYRYYWQQFFVKSTSNLGGYVVVAR